MRINPPRDQSDFKQSSKIIPDRGKINPIYYKNLSCLQYIEEKGIIYVEHPSNYVGVYFDPNAIRAFLTTPFAADVDDDAGAINDGPDRLEAPLPPGDPVARRLGGSGRARGMAARTEACRRTTIYG